MSMALRKALQRGVSKIKSVQWGDQDAAKIIKECVKSFTPLVIHNVLNGDQCAAIANKVASQQYELLVPFEGENLVSFSRNYWTEEAYPIKHLLVDDDENDDENHHQHDEKCESLFAQTRLPIDSVADYLPTVEQQQKLLGGFALNEEASMIFVTAADLRTPLHSDERHGVLLHISGHKNYVVIPAESSDRDPVVLRELLELRDVPGSHEELYSYSSNDDDDDDDDDTRGNVPPRALDQVVRFQGVLNPGSALYLPQRNLHDIESVSPTISISLRFGKWEQ